MKLKQKSLYDTLRLLKESYQNEYSSVETYLGTVLNNIVFSNKDINPDIIDIINYINFYLIPNDVKDLTKEIKSLIKKLNITIEDVCLSLVECKNCMCMDFKESDIEDKENRIIGEQRTIEFMSYQIIIQDLTFMLQTFKNKKVGRINPIKIDTLINDKSIELSKSSYLDYYKDTLCKTDPKFYLIEAGLAKFKLNLNDLKFGVNAIVSFITDEVLSHYYLKKLLPEYSEFYDLKTDSLNNLVIKLIMERIDESNVSSCPAFIELLRKRDFLIPHGGVNINGRRVIGNLSAGEFRLAKSIDLYERQYNDNNFLIVLDNSNEDCFITIINLHTGTLINTNPDLYGVLNRLYYFYELYKKDPVGGTLDPWLYYTFQIINVESGIKTIKGTLLDDFENYDVAVPYYWRYKGKYKNSSSSKNNNHLINNDKKTYISAFTRRLPKGHKRSEDAIRLSKIYCLQLGENETIVRPFERKNRGE